MIDRILGVTRVCCALVCFSGVTMSVVAEPTVKAVVYSPHGDTLSCHMNMGPTGAAAWMRGYHFQVMRIDQGSPADGVLELGDVVMGANGVLFGDDADPRMTLGNAIGQAEGTGEPLVLTVWRDDKRQTVSIDLPTLGDHVDGWPFDDTKSDHILNAACRSLLDAQLPNGRLPTDGDMGSFLTGLLLLASGDRVYLDGARRAAYYVDSIDYLKMDYNNWPMGYGGLLLAEYFLATGDDSVLEKLTWIADELAQGQMQCGSWGHKSPGAGYGALNQPGIVDAITLVLATECGVRVDQQALDKALAFFGQYAELGSIPYGDHMPRALLDDNGKNSSAAVLMHLAGREHEADAFSQSVAMSYWMREDGHTGAFFSFVWGPLAASLAGEKAFNTFMDYQEWFYNLARTWKGDLVHLPYKEALTRFDDSGYIYFGGDFTTGGMGLAFALPRQRLRILGAPKSVFSPRTELSASALRAVRRHYRDRDWNRVDKTLAGIDPDSLKTKTDKRAFKQLKAARELLVASTARTLMEIESNLNNGAAYQAQQQFEALKRRIGEEGDPRFEALETRFADGGVAWAVREGKRYKDAWAALKTITVMSWTAQGWQARRLLEGLPTLRLPVWEPLAPSGVLDAKDWRSTLVRENDALPTDWMMPTFDDSAWKEGETIIVEDEGRAEGEASFRSVAARRLFTVSNPNGDKLRLRLRTVRPTATRVYLNGVLIVDAVRGLRGGYADIELDDSVFGILKRGENLLAVISNARGSGNNHLDVGLDIARSMSERRHLPVNRMATPVLVDYPGMDDTLRVREKRERMEQTWRDDYGKKPVAQLLAELASPVAYARQLAVNALVDRGTEAIRAALALGRDSDWKVRSSVCDLVGKALADSQQQGGDGSLAALLDRQIPLLIKGLADEHFWVRARAAAAVDGFGDAAGDALPVLATMVQDPHEWVRVAAIRAIRRMKPSSALAIQAAQTALEQPNSAFTVPRVALSMLETAEAETDQQLASLLSLLRRPPEGGGGRYLNQAMDMARELDPDGDALIPVLIESVQDKTHFSRQRANPWGKAVNMLGSYGDKAQAAVPMLESILENADYKRLHEAATVALEAIKNAAE